MMPNIRTGFRRRWRLSTPTLGRLDSGLVMYPPGHARNTTADLTGLLEQKFHSLAALGAQDTSALYGRFSSLAEKSAERDCGAL